MNAPAPTWLRGPVFVTTTTVLALVAHVAAGDQVADGARTLLAMAAAGLAFAVVSRSEQTLARVVLLTAAVQAAGHLALSMSSSAGMSHGPSAGGGGLLMWSGHLLAAALLAGWLHRGERAAWDAVARALVAVARHLPTVPPATGTRPRIVPPAPRPLPRPALPVVGLRAPPAAA